MKQMDRSKIIEAWAAINVLVGYYEHPEDFTNKLSPKERALRIHSLLSSVVSSMDIGAKRIRSDEELLEIEEKHFNGMAGKSLLAAGGKRRVNKLLKKARTE